jgi:hypothetical protein
MEVSRLLYALVKESPVPIEQETAWAPKLVWALWGYIKKSLPLPGIEKRFVGKAISLDPISECPLFCRAILTALCLLASNRFIRISNPPVGLT